MVLWTASADYSTKKGDDKNEETCTSNNIIADMCAAPGSKSLQLLDLLYTSSATNNKHNSSSNDTTTAATILPSGLLVVNDSDRNRIITLCQRSRHVPRGPMLAINMDARYFPGIRRSHIIKHKEGYKQKYDKVLCDVPCSGDGTTRKNKQVWNTWSMGHAMSLHRLQRRILRRGLELLRPRGTLVYSTCSLNPLEDEAVVASVINDVGGIDAVEIVPLPTWLVQKCQSLNGLDTWLVPHPQFGKKGMGEMYQSFDDVPMEHQGGGTKEKGDKKKKGGQISRTMFPPTTNDSLTTQLRNCGRFIPNNSLDSGGFFVACLRRLKVGELGGGFEAKSNATGAEEAVEQEEAPFAESSGMNDVENTVQPSTEAESQDADSTPAAAVDLREGDWYCSSCKKLNFGCRNGSSCFSCKERKPKPRNTEKKGDKIQQPLLRKPDDEEDGMIMNAFFDQFGIQKDEFPLLDNLRIIHRKEKKVIVVVSSSLSKLAISDTWSPV